VISKSSLAAFASGIIILSAGFECLVEPQVAQAVERESVRLSPREIFRRTASQWSGDIFLLPKYGNTTLETWEFDPKHWQVSTIAGRKLPPHPMTMHGIAWDYDLEIPIVFFDPTNKYFKSGSFKKLAVQQDIVPTLAAILGVPAPAKKGGRVLTEALQKINIGQNDGPRGLPKAILVLIQDQVGRHYLAAHRDRAPFYDRLQKRGANFLNASVAHVDVETSVGHASIGTGSWPAEHGVAGNRFFHSGFWRQLSSFTIELSGLESARKKNPSLFFVPTLSDIWSVARAGKPVILSVAPVARAAISVGGHGGLFVGGSKSYVTWTEENGGDGTWVTEPENYRMPESFKNKPALPWVKDFLGQSKSWRGHALISDDGKVDSRNLLGSPALVKQQGDLTRDAIKELKIGEDGETDLIWFNTKSTDYCGHFYGYESEECGDVLSAADDEARKIVELLDKQTGGNYLVVLTADHGAARLPEVSGAYRVDRLKLKKELNEKFDRRSNNIDVVQVITVSQVYLNHSELQASGFKVADVVRFLRNYKGKMEFPYNALADEWIKKGKPRQALFFEDVVDKETLTGR
jgi:hypothetical protein